ncbi:hypothetical protein ACFXGI_38485 [Streptomyces sp. NPDC059355]|uniref:hypothetical protein n=1 Tax=Streptomyces sp. NPDC059355 TaxID=3346811 RepID=UPI0036C23FD3
MKKIDTQLAHMAAMDIVGDRLYVTSWNGGPGQGANAGVLYKFPAEQADGTQPAPEGPIANPNLTGMFGLSVVTGTDNKTAAAAFIVDLNYQSLWKVPLGANASNPIRVSQAGGGLDKPISLVMAGMDEGYFTTNTGQVWSVEPHVQITKGLGDPKGIALDALQQNLYITDNAGGRLWRVSLKRDEDGNYPKSVIATGMTSAYGVTLRREPAADGGMATWAYVGTSSQGNLWRVNVDSVSGEPVEVTNEANLAAFNLNLGGTGAAHNVRFNSKGDAYICAWGAPWIWKITGISTPTDAPKPPPVVAVVKILSKMDGVEPSFSGTVSPVVAGAKLFAFVDGVKRSGGGAHVNPDGTWAFYMQASADGAPPYAPGQHTLKMAYTDEAKGAVLATAEIVFTVAAPTPPPPPKPQGIVIVAPLEGAQIAGTPKFTVTVPKRLEAGVMLRAVDEYGAVIADGLAPGADGITYTFERNGKLGPWNGPGHKVTVTARKEGADLGSPAPASVNFNVPEAKTPIIVVPARGAKTTSIPDFKVQLPTDVSMDGVTILARDETGTIINANPGLNRSGPGWHFNRNVGPWTMGVHTVVITARKGNADLPGLTPAVVTFTVDRK